MSNVAYVSGNYGTTSEHNTCGRAINPKTDATSLQVCAQIQQTINRKFVQASCTNQKSYELLYNRKHSVTGHSVDEGKEIVLFLSKF